MYSSIFIVIGVAALGFFLKRVWPQIFNKELGDMLLGKVLFYVVLPATIFLNISQLKLSSELFLLPISVWFISFICFLVAFLYAKWVKLGNKTKGALFAGTTMINMQMVGYPFISLTYGAEAFGRLMIFEFGGYLLAFTFVYGLVVYYGAKSRAEKGTKEGSGEARKRILQTLKQKLIAAPPIWALFLGIIVNFTQISLPGIVKDFLDVIGKPTFFMLLFSLGLYFEPKLDKIKHLAAGIFIRIGIGFAAGLLAVTLFQFEGLNRVVVLTMSIMPAGYNALVFSVKEDADKEFAASLVAISVVVSLAIIPILTFFLG